MIRGRASGRTVARAAVPVSMPMSMLASILALALGCAPIDVNSEVSLHPREAPVRSFGVQQLSDRDYVVDYVQLEARLLLTVREQRRCVAVSHIPVLRVEHIDRSNRNFVIWDFALGSFFGAFAGLAFARPELFSDRLVDSNGRVVYANTAGYVVGGVFAAISAGLLAAGVVDGLRSRDETRYAEAYELQTGPESGCAGEDPSGRVLGGRRLRLRIGEEIELEATTNDEGRARFNLPAAVAELPTDTGLVAAMLEIGAASGEGFEAKQPLLRVRVPFDGMSEAHTGVADTRAGPAQTAAIELDRPRFPGEPEGERAGFGVPEADPGGSASSLGPVPVGAEPAGVEATGAEPGTDPSGRTGSEPGGSEPGGSEPAEPKPTALEGPKELGA